MSGEYLGDFAGTETLVVVFDTFDSNGASVTMSGLATTDIEIYKSSSVTQRSSDSGYTLIDTDGIDIDGATGIHGFTVDLSDDTDAGFYSPQNDYYIVVNAVTIDSQTVRFIAARFSIQNRYNDLNVKSISGDSSAADNLETMLDGTGGQTLSLGQLSISRADGGANIVLAGSGTGDGVAFTRSGTGDPFDTNFMAQINAEVDTAISDASLATAANLATVDTVVDRIEADTQDIQSRLPAALVSGKMDSDATAISGDTVAADRLEALMDGTVTGSAQTGTLSTTQMTTDLAETTDDHYIGRLVTFKTGALAGQQTDITDYSGTNGLLTFTALTEAPSNGDTFVIT